MPQLLVVHHTTSPITQELLEAALDGTRMDGLGEVEVVVRPALAATVSDALAADGFLIGTPANIGYMAGAVKVFFDSIYYPTLTAKPGAPYGLYVHGNNDTAGAVRAIESIARGLQWRKVGEAIEVIGAVFKEDRDRVSEMAATVAATLV